MSPKIFGILKSKTNGWKGKGKPMYAGVIVTTRSFTAGTRTISVQQGQRA